MTLPHAGGSNIHFKLFRYNLFVYIYMYTFITYILLCLYKGEEIKNSHLKIVFVFLFYRSCVLMLRIIYPTDGLNLRLRSM